MSKEDWLEHEDILTALRENSTRQGNLVTCTTTIPLDQFKDKEEYEKIQEFIEIAYTILDIEVEVKMIFHSEEDQFAVICVQY